MMEKLSHNNLWLYWEGDLPPFVELCIEIIRKKYDRVILVNKTSVRYYLPELRYDIDQVVCVSPAKSKPQHHISVRTAYIRAALLYKFGGIWLDADTIVTGDIRAAFAGLNDYDYIGYYKQTPAGSHVSIGFIGSRPGGEVISAHMKKLDQRLNQNLKVKWGELGAYMITPIVLANKSICRLYSNHQIQPIMNHRTFLKEEPIDKYIKPDTLLVQLFNSGFPDKIRNMSISELLGGDILLSKIFRRALNSWRYDI